LGLQTKEAALKANVPHPVHPGIFTMYELPGVTEILFVYAKAPPPPPDIDEHLFPCPAAPAPTATTETEVTPAGATHE
jgi:hypothetical protein